MQQSLRQHLWLLSVNTSVRLKATNMLNQNQTFAKVIPVVKLDGTVILYSFSKNRGALSFSSVTCTLTVIKSLSPPPSVAIIGISYNFCFSRSRLKVYEECNYGKLTSF